MNSEKEEFYKITQRVDTLCMCIKESIQDWRKAASHRDVSNDIEEISEKARKKVRTDIDQLLEYLNKRTIDSYEFTYGANRAAQSLDNEVSNFLEEIVRDFSKKTDGEKKRNDAFIAYYLLAYIYRLYAPDKLERFLEKYERFFKQHYALTYQIRGRELRAKGKLEEAIQNDQIALQMLKRHGIENIGVKVTYASSIAVALENGIMKVNQDDIDDSIANVEQAIQMNREYSRYHYLLARLKLYQIRNEMYSFTDKTLEEWSKNKVAWVSGLRKAEESIQTALNYLKKQASSYTEFYVTYRETADSIKRLRMEIDLFEKLYEQFQRFDDQNRKKAESLKSEILEKNEQAMEERSKADNLRLQQARRDIEKTNKGHLDEIQKNIETELGKSQIKYLEILAVFVAIVGVIVTTNGLLTKDFTFSEAILGIIAMNAGIVAVYACFKIIFSQEKICIRYIVILVVACVTILISLVSGNCNLFGGYCYG